MWQLKSLHVTANNAIQCQRNRSSLQHLSDSEVRITTPSSLTIMMQECWRYLVLQNQIMPQSQIMWQRPRLQCLADWSYLLTFYLAYLWNYFRSEIQQGPDSWCAQCVENRRGGGCRLKYFSCTGSPPLGGGYVLVKELGQKDLKENFSHKDLDEKTLVQKTLKNSNSANKT